MWTGVHNDDKPFAIPSDFTSLVCAVDRNASCVKVISWARDLAVEFKARMTVVHAIPAADETSGNRGEIDLRRYLFRVAEEKFGEICREAGLDVKVSLAGGPVAQVVREQALRFGAELVVFGRGQTKGGLGRLGTNMYSIIRSAPCPVLSI